MRLAGGWNDEHDDDTLWWTFGSAVFLINKSILIPIIKSIGACMNKFICFLMKSSEFFENLQIYAKIFDVKNNKLLQSYPKNI